MIGMVSFIVAIVLWGFAITVISLNTESVYIDSFKENISILLSSNTQVKGNV